MNKAEQYQHAISAIENLIHDETDEIALMATVVCTLHHQFKYFHWTFRSYSPRYPCEILWVSCRFHG